MTPAETQNLELLVGNARAAVDRGDLFAAYGVIQELHDAGLCSGRSQYLEVLILARMGDPLEALRRYDAYGLSAAEDADALAIRARLLKDLAFDAPQEERVRLLQEAADAYAEVHGQKGGYFPLINAATLALMAGAHEVAAERAEAVLIECAHPREYWEAATKAEALLVLGRASEAASAVADAVSMPGANFGSCCSTMRQLARLLEHLGFPEGEAEGFLKPLQPPPVAAYTGHIFGHDPAREAGLAEEIGTVLNRNRVRVACGSLAAGADIIFAEKLLGQDAELHVVLPFNLEDFLRESVSPAGPEWVVRFNDCLSRASSITFASKMNYVGDEQQFAYGARVAMGMARVRAEQLCTNGIQLAVWDGQETGSAAGTGADIRAWRNSGGKTVIIGGSNLMRVKSGTTPAVGQVERAAHALMFTDFSGFSKITEPVLPYFWREVMERSAALIERFGEDIKLKNSWGDAIFLVIESAAVAAEVALNLQAELGRADLAAIGTQGTSSMRIAMHFGPIYRTEDRILGRPNYFGTEVSRAARLEPVTPPGSIYVTEPFAANLCLEAGEKYRLVYVGQVKLAKQYGTFPIYRLSYRGQHLT